MSRTETRHDTGALKLRKLQRHTGEVKLGKPVILVLPNSVRSTLTEIERLRDEEFARTGIRWEVTNA